MPTYEDISVPTGYILPSERTPEQQRAHALAVASMPKFGISGSGVKTTTGSSNLDVHLYRALTRKEVLEDIGLQFYRYHQQTGSCVGAGLGQVLVVLSAVQRLFAKNPTKAALFFWLFNYGRSRWLYGWKTPGEGSFGSTAAKSVRDEGVIPINDKTRALLPAFKDAGKEGIIYSEQIEMRYSDGDIKEVMQLLTMSKEYPVGQVAELNNTAQMAESLANGYPLTIASGGHCRRVQEKEGVLIGTNSTGGGHQWAIVAVVDHPKLGRLFGNLNNWPESIYPLDPFSQWPCFYWTTERETENTLRNEGECYSFSNFTYFPAQPDIAVPWLI